MTTITVRLDPEIEHELAELAMRTGRSKSDLVREALRRQLAVAHFEEVRRGVTPYAKAKGWLTDEDIFKVVS